MNNPPNLEPDIPLPASPACGKTIEDVYNILLGIQASINTIQNEQKSIIKQIKELSDSQQFLSDKYDELSNQIKIIPKLESQLEVREEEIEDLKIRLVQSEQYSRRHHLEIGNIPNRQNENVEEIIIEVASKMKLPLEKKDIAADHRLRAGADKIPSIIVEFENRKVRDEFFRKRKLLKDAKERIYVNESLCPYFKNLLRATKNECKLKGYKFNWFRNNKIFVKRDESSTPISIVNYTDLKKLTLKI